MVLPLNTRAVCGVRAHHSIYDEHLPKEACFNSKLGNFWHGQRVTNKPPQLAFVTVCAVGVRRLYIDG